MFFKVTINRIGNAITPNPHTPRPTTNEKSSASKIWPNFRKNNYATDTTSTGDLIVGRLLCTIINTDPSHSIPIAISTRRKNATTQLPKRTQVAGNWIAICSLLFLPANASSARKNKPLLSLREGESGKPVGRAQILRRGCGNAGNRWQAWFLECRPIESALNVGYITFGKYSRCPTGANDLTAAARSRGTALIPTPPLPLHEQRRP